MSFSGVLMGIYLVSTVRVLEKGMSDMLSILKAVSRIQELTCFVKRQRIVARHFVETTRGGYENMKALFFTLIFALACAAPAGFAQQDDPAAPPPIPPLGTPDTPPEEPAIPPKVRGEQVEPTVDIRRDEDDNIIEEYSVDGRIYMVKVTPKHGVPYYYLDENGDGQLEIRERDRAANPVRPVYWRIKEW